ncbi:MAG: hypothetical protein NXI26_24965 [bacterium]|nr:hypothetical protein [bacterium]
MVLGGVARTLQIAGGAMAILTGLFATPITAAEKPEPLSEELVAILGSQYDVNDDGNPDVFYDYDVDLLPGYFELTDRNFDGKIDESTYFSGEHTAQYGRADNDFNGQMDTVIEYKHQSISNKWIDRDENRVIDTWLNYRNGELAKAKRYYPKSESSPSSVGTVVFQFSYPAIEQIETSTLTEIEFEASSNLIVPLWSNE